MSLQTSVVARQMPDWRHLTLAVFVFGSLAWVFSRGPMSQDQAYHAFVDTRCRLGVANFSDVCSNLVFLLIGIAGIRFCLRARQAVSAGWIVFFAGVGLVSVGSAYYHLRPTDATLVWDRLPMTIAFMGLFAAVVGDQAGRRLGSLLLVPLVLLGLGSVLYWRWTGGLRLYYWVQLVAMLTIPVVTILYRRSYSYQWLLLVALGCYVLAKIAETHDGAVFQQTGGLVSGHTMKHLLAASGGFAILRMLQRRAPVTASDPEQDRDDEDAAELGCAEG